MSYLPCELHCHTVHSDGDFTVKELQENAKSDHLAAFALTDHNTMSGYDELDDSIIPAIRGIEWTTYFGHMLVLGAKSFVDWRDAVPDNIDDKIKAVKEVGGIVGIAHPYQMGSPVCTGGRWEFNIKNWHNVDYMEIWHENMSGLSSENEKSLKLWTDLLDLGFKIAASYGRDWHRMEKSGHYGCTYIDIDGEVNEKNVIRAIRMGKTIVSTGAKFFFRVHRLGSTYEIGSTVRKGTYTFSFFTDLHSREKDAGEESVIYKTIKIISNGGKTVLETRCDERHTRLKLECGKWYRAELWGTVDGEKKPLAITSPIYCE
ncbi:MAG: CehA/McbA family metallohydrolase [Acetobacter sp.]|nr:CehA/McbA family metallohydrolase [Bacteroides sp.]MCM1341810.1 CehA/McbA family metallohydrolase [Acetobacter sp.]MCM1433976.1 CehA/McbA family metallohydrolase [Clostridiales bacterium]